MKHIDSDSLKEYLTNRGDWFEETFENLTMKHNLDYLHNVDEDDVERFANDFLDTVINIVDSEPRVNTDYLCYYYNPAETPLKIVWQNFQQIKDVINMPVIGLPYNSYVQTMSEDQLVKIRDNINSILGN